MKKYAYQLRLDGVRTKTCYLATADPALASRLLQGYCSENAPPGLTLDLYQRRLGRWRPIGQVVTQAGLTGDGVLAEWAREQGVSEPPGETL